MCPIRAPSRAGIPALSAPHLTHDNVLYHACSRYEPRPPTSVTAQECRHRRDEGRPVRSGKGGGRSRRPRSRPHSRIVSSSGAAAARRPSGSTPSALTPPECPSRRAVSAPVVAQPDRVVIGARGEAAVGRTSCGPTADLPLPHFATVLSRHLIAEGPFAGARICRASLIPNS
jgi:hypothetical protein